MFAVRADVAVLDPRLPARSDIAVLVSGTRILDVGPAQSLLPAVTGTIPVHEVGVLMPGMVDGHSHGRGHTLAQQDLGEDADLLALLVEFTAHTPVPVHDDAMVAAAGLVGTGVTAARVVYHSFAAAQDYSAELTSMVTGLSTSGLSVTMALGITDRDEYLPASACADSRFPPELRCPRRGLSIDGWRAVVTELASSFRPEQGSGVGQVNWEVAPVNPRWCSPALLTAAATLCSSLGIGVHTHLLEAAWQRGTPAARGDLEACVAAGLVGSGFSAAHGVWLRPPEMAELAELGGSLVHCPVSNRRLHVGTAPLRRWLDAGISVAIGLDSNTDQPPDMFATLRAALRAAAELGDPLSETKLLTTATVGGARSLGDPDWTGVVAPGARADLVGLDLRSSPETVVADIVLRASRTDIHAVWGAGSLLYKQGQQNDTAAAAVTARVEAVLREDADRRRAVLRRLRASIGPVREAWG